MTPVNLDAAAAAVLSWLLTYAIHSTILLALAAIAAWRLADRHEWLDVIWKAALMAPLITSSLQIEPLALPIGARWSMPMATVTTTATPVPLQQEKSPEPVRLGEKRDEARPNPVRSHENIERRSPGVQIPWVPAIAMAWLLLAIGGVLHYVLRLRRVYRVLKSGSPVTDADLLQTIDGWRSATARRAVVLTTNEICPVPLALAGRHIVLPQRLTRELDPEQQRAAIAHEMAHVARRDPEWRIAFEILDRVLFFQPLNRLARTRLCDAAEFLCDEWAVKQLRSPLAMARCLSVVASWWSPADELPAGVSAMARSDSAMVRRVSRILDESAPIARHPRWFWLAIPVGVVAIAAPRVTATQLPAAAVVTPALPAALGISTVVTPTEPHAEQRDWTVAEIATARAQLRVHRPSNPGASLDQRWRDALTEAGRQGLNDFWIVYTFNTPIHANDVTLSDSRGDSIVSSDGRLSVQGPPLTALFGASAVPLEGGRLAVLMHHSAPRADAIDRAGYRTAHLGFEFGRAPVFWLGEAEQSQSFNRVQNLFSQNRNQGVQTLLIELASMHSNSDVVIPFLATLVDQPWPPVIRREAAEGFDHHHVPRSVEILLRVARNDPDSSVRAEAAETIGEVQTPESIAALHQLVSESDDPEVRHEAAEGFGAQPAARALPAIQRVLATNTHDDVLTEAIEALAELEGASVLAILEDAATGQLSRSAQQEAVETLGEVDEPGVVEALVRIAMQHSDPSVQREAVETLGDRKDDPAAVAAIERILREHSNEEVQAEAVETLGDIAGDAMPAAVLALVESASSPRIRREAIETIADVFDKISDTRTLDTTEQLLERVVFNDADHGVRMEALDAMDELPGERAERVLRRIADTHPDARMRREAAEQLRERQ